MNIQEAIQQTAGKLAEAGVAEPVREASSLLGYVLGRDRTFLIAHPEYVLSEKEAADLSNVTADAPREPYQYIVGKQEFTALSFWLTPCAYPGARNRAAGRTRTRSSEVSTGAFCESASVRAGHGCHSCK